MKRNHTIGTRAVALLSASLVLASCVDPFAGSTETPPVAGTEFLTMSSSEPAFFDTAAGVPLVDAQVIEMFSDESISAPPVGDVVGTVDVVGRNANLLGLRWVQAEKDSEIACEGFYEETQWTTHCSDTRSAEPRVLYHMSCPENAPAQTMVGTLDERIVSLRVDLVDGATVVATDPDGLGMLALMVPGAIATALAQTVDGRVMVIDSVSAGAICPLN